MNATCPLHPDAEPLLRWRRFGNDTWHVEARCPACGRFIAWAPQTPANVEMADHHLADERGAEAPSP
jgi:hypothetical protein